MGTFLSTTRIASDFSPRWLGWDEQEFQRRSKGAREKVRLAGRLRRETTMTLKWIAGRLHMGTWTYASNLLAAQRKEMCQ